MEPVRIPLEEIPHQTVINDNCFCLEPLTTEQRKLGHWAGSTWHAMHPGCAQGLFLSSNDVKCPICREPLEESPSSFRWHERWNMRYVQPLKTKLFGVYQLLAGVVFLEAGVLIGAVRPGRHQKSLDHLLRATGALLMAKGTRTFRPDADERQLTTVLLGESLRIPHALAIFTRRTATLIKSAPGFLAGALATVALSAYQDASTLTRLSRILASPLFVTGGSLALLKISDWFAKNIQVCATTHVLPSSSETYPVFTLQWETPSRLVLGFRDPNVRQDVKDSIRSILPQVLNSIPEHIRDPLLLGERRLVISNSQVTDDGAIRFHYEAESISPANPEVEVTFDPSGQPIIPPIGIDPQAMEQLKIGIQALIRLPQSAEQLETGKKLFIIYHPTNVRFRFA